MLSPELHAKINHLLTRLKKDTEKFSLIQLVRILTFFNHQHDDVLKLKFTDNLTQSFQASEVAAIDFQIKSVEVLVTIRVNILALMGASGILPNHDKLDLLSTQKARHPIAVAFINLFHHYLIAAYIQLAFKFHPSIALTKINFDQIKQALLGSQQHSTLLANTRLWIQKDKSAASLGYMLSFYTGYDIRICECQPYFFKFNPDEGFLLGASSALGQTTTVGHGLRIDKQHVQIVFYAEDDAHCIVLYENKALQKKVAGLTKNYLGPGFQLSFDFIAKKTQLGMVLGQNKLLGVNAYL